MVDALLYAVRDEIRANASFEQGYATCEIVSKGQPPPRFGNLFVGVSQGATRSTNDNCLNEYFGFNLTLVMRVTVPLDRIGDQLISRNVFQTTVKRIGFNQLAEQLRALVTINGGTNGVSGGWSIIARANQYLIDWNPNWTGDVYGFCEPARYRGMEEPVPVGGVWLGASPDSDDFGVKAELRFVDARRMQAIGTYA